MGISLFNKTTIPLLGKALDAYTLRQKVIASNIANIATPEYKAQKVDFEDQLAGAVQGSQISGAQTDPRHIAIGVSSPSDASGRVIDAHRLGDGSDPRASGVNDVDVDSEMADLAKDQIQFRFAARMITDMFRGIQKSIRGQS